jgi:hypothetical protein
VLRARAASSGAPAAYVATPNASTVSERRKPTPEVDRALRGVRALDRELDARAALDRRDRHVVQHLGRHEVREARTRVGEAASTAPVYSMATRRSTNVPARPRATSV